jgi:hypothetical protein
VETTDPQLTYYIINTISQQLLIYLVPWLVVIVLIVVAMIKSKRQTTKILERQAEIESELSDIKKILEDRKK